MKQTVRDAVAEALGYGVPGEVIADALAGLRGHTTNQLQARLKKKEAAFRGSGRPGSGPSRRDRPVTHCTGRSQGKTSEMRTPPNFA